jgi:hypothetical protein
MAAKPSDNLERVLGMLEVRTSQMPIAFWHHTNFSHTQALKSDVRTASTQLAHSSHDSNDFTSIKHGGIFSANARGANTSFTIESLQSNSDHSKEGNLSEKGRFELPSLSDSLAEESYGFIDTSHRKLPLQTRSTGFELSSKYRHETRSPWAVSPVASKEEFGDTSGQQLQDSQRMKSTANSAHESGDRSALKNVKLPVLPQLKELSIVSDDGRKSRVFIDEMHKDLQNTLHQLKVLHAFPPGSNFEDEHSGLVQSILAMTKQLASLMESSYLHDALKPQTTGNKISANELRDLVYRAFNSDSILSSHQSIADISLSDSSPFCCTRNNLFCSIRECVTKTRSDWSAEKKHLEEKLFQSCQEIKMIRQEAADTIEQATAQYKDADIVWESTHAQHLITIGNLREQLHNITVRYSNLQVESKSELEMQAKDFRQQISHLQGQVGALKQVADTQTFHNSEETRRYEALRVEHDKLLQTLSLLPQRDGHYDALSAENSKIQQILQQKQTDYDSLLFNYSSLQSNFDQQQIAFQQLVVNSRSSKEGIEINELRSQNSELLADQKNIRDALVASLRTVSALENENNRLQQCLDQKSLEVSEKDDEIRKHELFQLACAETEAKKVQECTAILQEARIMYRNLPCIPQDSENADASALELQDLCSFIHSDLTIILDRHVNLEKTVQELRQRIKTLRTQAKVASSKALKGIEDRIYEVENTMDHTVDASLRQQILEAVDGAKSQLRDLNVAHEHHYVMGTQDIKDRLYKNIMESNIRDRSLRAKISAIFQPVPSERNAGRQANQ